jgi:hypothetical protein
VSCPSVGAEVLFLIFRRKNKWGKAAEGNNKRCNNFLIDSLAIMQYEFWWYSPKILIKKGIHSMSIDQIYGTNLQWKGQQTGGGSHLWCSWVFKYQTKGNEDRKNTLKMSRQKRKVNIYTFWLREGRNSWRW